MEPETLLAMEHNVFTPGNYFYNGIGHVTVHYDWVLAVGFKGIRTRAENELKACCPGQGNYAKKSRFLQAVIISCDAAIHYAHRYAELAYREAEACADPARKKELLVIAKNCLNVPENGASDFYEACQSFWFVQQLLQMESSGHSISPGRFDQYMYPYFKKDYDAGKITLEFAQELLDCIWIKLNDLNKCRDAASAEGFAGYSLFQNLIVGGQNEEGLDVTNELSYMCLEASMHVQLPQPSLSIRVWNGSPEDLLIKAAELTRTGRRPARLLQRRGDYSRIDGERPYAGRRPYLQHHRLRGTPESGEDGRLARRRILQHVPSLRIRPARRQGRRRSGRPAYGRRGAVYHV